MNHTLYNYISSMVVFGIAACLAIRALKEYITVMKTPGIRFFMSRRELKQATDPAVVNAVQRWNRIARRLFIIWIITCILGVLVPAIIDNTIGFKD